MKTTSIFALGIFLMSCGFIVALKSHAKVMESEVNFDFVPLYYGKEMDITTSMDAVIVSLVDMDKENMLMEEVKRYVCTNHRLRLCV